MPLNLVVDRVSSHISAKCIDRPVSSNRAGANIHARIGDSNIRHIIQTVKMTITTVAPSAVQIVFPARAMGPWEAHI